MIVLARPLRNTIFVSLLSHFALFGFFSFNFGGGLPEGSQAGLSFWGRILSNSDIAESAFKNYKEKPLPIDMLNSLSKPVMASGLESIALKPAVFVGLLNEKTALEESSEIIVLPVKKEPVITFHPLLPYNFTLYFKDRQTVHIEVMFKIISGQSSLLIKRKISSGNLEADLLTMRYIAHYLFVQQARFNPDTWQSVKIDLSVKDENQ